LTSGENDSLKPSEFITNTEGSFQTEFMNNKKLFAWILALSVLSVIAFLILHRSTAPTGPESAKGESLLQKTLRTKTIKVGYGGYPPFLSRDLKTGEMKGYSVALIKQIFDPVDVKIEWVETSWATMRDDLILGKFDLMVEPIIMTIPRSARVGFSRPYTYFGYASVVVKSNESRFSRMQDLNSPQIRVAVSQGVTDHEFALKRLPKCNLQVISGNDIAQVMEQVLIGKSDAALVDVPSAKKFLKAHPADVKVLFSDPPPAITPAGFMTRQQEYDLINFLNNALLALESDGTLQALEDEYDLPTYHIKREQIEK
jgi:cyclohexadienyl dehydratase